MPSGKSKRTHSKGRKTKLHKSGVRKIFSARHIDQVWEDVRKERGVHDGASGPIGTTSKVVLDEDLPAEGQHYCISCSRYFQSETALQDHKKTKPHKRRIKQLLGPRPHDQQDADWAAGMGAPHNGKEHGILDQMHS